MIHTKGKGRAILPQGVSVRPDNEASRELVRKRADALLWMFRNGKALVDGGDATLAYAHALQEAARIPKA